MNFTDPNDPEFYMGNIFRPTKAQTVEALRDVIRCFKETSKHFYCGDYGHLELRLAALMARKPNTVSRREFRKKWRMKWKG